MRLPGIPIVSPERVLEELAALSRVARTAPAQLERLLQIGEEIVSIGHSVLELGERIDARAEAILALGERIDGRAEQILSLGERLEQRGEGLVELGEGMRELAREMDARGAEIVDRAGLVAQTGAELVNAIPTLERAIEMTTPLEGAIDRFGRLVDRLPGGGAARRRPEG